ncbi:hypothetical protein [Streptomyces sp. SLBN-8D4]|uniref:hypothetical protein n=1 Tax=Streptomyces sp. SLBN-8D4 TaxID=3377728 RepID=UPI003C7D22E1
MPGWDCAPPAGSVTPDRPFVRVEGLIAELGQPPYWLRDFTADLAAKYCVSRT